MQIAALADRSASDRQPNIVMMSDACGFHPDRTAAMS